MTTFTPEQVEVLRQAYRETYGDDESDFLERIGISPVPHPQNGKKYAVSFVLTIHDGGAFLVEQGEDCYESIPIKTLVENALNDSAIWDSQIATTKLQVQEMRTA